MRKLLRLGFSIGLGALCIGILTLVASLLSWIKLVDVYTVVSSSVIAGVYIGVGVLGMLLGFIFYPKMMRGIAGGMKRIEAKLTQVPMQDVLSGILGLIVGLILALLLSTLINRIPIPWLSMLLSVSMCCLAIWAWRSRCGENLNWASWKKLRRPRARKNMKKPRRSPRRVGR